MGDWAVPPSMQEPSLGDGVRWRWHGGMKPKRIVREREAHDRLGCGRSKFRRDYVLRDPDDPCIPGTQIKRLRPVPLGVRNHGFLDRELDDLVDAFAAERDRPSKRPAPSPQAAAIK